MTEGATPLVKTRLFINNNNNNNNNNNSNNNNNNKIRGVGEHFPNEERQN